LSRWHGWPVLAMLSFIFFVKIWRNPYLAPDFLQNETNQGLLAVPDCKNFTHNGLCSNNLVPNTAFLVYCANPGVA